ncbi:MAG: HAD hydrolase-like protein [Sphingomonadales bacterium]|nr:HAD hydrolase-like protein [Sphingomonadales bacterium]MBD3772410.1 HAD hydrolase-like protein [Paracoccaceae bacterium]
MTRRPRPRALLLDLDGTLIDGAPDLAAALGEVLSQYGRTPLDVDQTRRFVGHGVARLVGDAFAHTGAPLAGDQLAQAVHAMERAYAARLTVDTILLPGARELVDSCGTLGIALACVTNKPTAMAREILEFFGLVPGIAEVLGGDLDLPRKPAPEPLLAAIDRLGVDKAQAWMVGDGLPDIGAARAAGVTMACVPSRFGEEFDAHAQADMVFASLHELRDALAETGAQ